MTCPRCLHRDCLCAEIPTIETRTRVIIVRHHGEVTRSSNTGRLAHLALRNSEIIDHGGGGPTVLPPLAGAYVVYPLGEVATRCPDPPPEQLVILDATWSQARRMYRKLPLRGVPTLHLALIGGPARLRAAPDPGHVSTIEAIAGALRLVEGDAPAAQLDQLFQRAIDRAAASGRRVVRSPTIDES